MPYACISLPSSSLRACMCTCIEGSEGVLPVHVCPGREDWDAWRQMVQAREEEWRMHLSPPPPRRRHGVPLSLLLLPLALRPRLPYFTPCSAEKIATALVSGKWTPRRPHSPSLPATHSLLVLPPPVAHAHTQDERSSGRVFRSRAHVAQVFSLGAALS
jgi:hypothetical protein